MSSWFTYLDHSTFENFYKSRFSSETPDWSKSIDVILQHLSHHQKWNSLSEYIASFEVSVRMFDNPDLSAAILMNKEESIYVKRFFYNTLVTQMQLQFHTYLIGLHLLIQKEDEDFLIDIHKALPDFLSSRKKLLNQEEFQFLYSNPSLLNPSHVKAFIFTNWIHYDHLSKVSALEKKLIRDYLGVQETKKILGLHPNDYKYIEENPLYAKNNDTDLDRYYDIDKEIMSRRIDFVEYTQEYLQDKKLLFWCWWTISPFVCSDITILLPLICESKNIKYIYIDLCIESESFYQKYIEGHPVTEERLEEEIKKIYPPFLKNSQKEVFPYQILLETLRQFSIPIKCFGFSGTELINTQPFLNEDNTIEYSTNKRWEKIIYQEYHNIHHLDENDIIIYLYFMKPMFVFPSIKDSRIEKVIHTDQFTGFGAKRPENSIALYSWYKSNYGESFIFPYVYDSSFKEEQIIYFPQSKPIHALSNPEKSFQVPTLDHSKFNQFKLYDTMIYSSKHDRGNQNPHILHPQLHHEWST